jgi:hypothetical protein
MPLTDIIIVSAVTLAFVVFAVVLAWGDHQTREIARAGREHALTGGRAASPKPIAEGTARRAEAKSKAPAQP